MESTNRVAEGPKQTAALINAVSPDEIAFGPSSTMLVENLARAIDKDILDDEEIIITGEHEGMITILKLYYLYINFRFSKLWTMEEASYPSESQHKAMASYYQSRNAQQSLRC